MLLTDKNIVQIRLDNENIDIELNFKTLENIYHFLKDEYMCYVYGVECNNTFDFIADIKNKDYMAVLLYCMSDGRIAIQKIREILNDFKEYEELVSLVEINLIYQLITEEDKLLKEEKREINKEKAFEDYFNNFYTRAVVELKMTIDEFYSMTPYKLKTIIKNIDESKKKGILLAYIDIMKARSSNAEKENVKVVKDANEFFDLI